MSPAWPRCSSPPWAERPAGGNEAAAEVWLSKLPSRLTLSPDEATRLRARLVWFGAKGVVLAKAKKTLGDATHEEKEFCAWSATVAAGATGDVGKPQVAVLEAIHDALGVPRSSLYSGLNASIGEAATSASEPGASVGGGRGSGASHLAARRGGRTVGHRPSRSASAPRPTGSPACSPYIFVEEEQPPELAEDARGGPLAGTGRRTRGAPDPTSLAHGMATRRISTAR